MKIEKQVLKALRRTGHPMTPEQLARELDDGVPVRRVAQMLEAFVRGGSAIDAGGGRYLALRERGILVGRIQMTRKGYGFVSAHGGDVYVAGRDTAGAMHGDTVACRLHAKRARQGLSGHVVEILERANQVLVGVYERHGKVGLVVPTDPRVRRDVFVPREESMDARNGEAVLVRLTVFPTGTQAAQGVIEEVLGMPHDPGVDIEMIIREHGLRTRFPEEVRREAAEVRLDVEEVLAGDPSREDVRGWFTVTIDPADAKDFDDAITLERVGEGFRLGVHIADVSHYVPWGSPTDVEARTRATSVYLVDRVLPMLPHELSTDVCSLKPAEDRLSFSVVMELDRAGAVRSYRLFPSAMRSDRRLDYDQVDEWIDTGTGFPDELTRDLLLDLEKVAHALRERRLARGGLDFETVEAKVILAEDRRTPVEVRVRQRTNATGMIEEAMILANEVVAGHMSSVGAPMVYRIHEDPDPDALAQVAVILKEFDYPVKDIGGASPQTFQRIIRFAHNRPEKLLINSLLLRALQRARYTDYLGPHFGLASEAYTHFTSPIRRYPDLIAHRLLRAQLAGALEAEPTASMVPELHWLADHSSTMEREAEAAEDESTRVKLTELMAAHVGEAFEGIITSVNTFGLFVQLPNTAEGLVHVSAMKDDYYRLDAERFLLYGERKGRVFRLGDTLRVRLVDAVVGERRLDFELA
ncbi:MAG: ribonuclease R [Coriobacteriia bacterium]|nr:ribonuclease R [Coriobacteriia bacterium]